MHQDELKKLYTQLEVHKTKKMTTNNPHLSKKRSSRCALGRSIIKRIVEIPETMSRQCSREEKDGSFRSKGANQSDSFRRPPDTVSVSYRSSITLPSPSPSMRKSKSDHHYVMERDSSLRDSTLRANSVKRSSQHSETDSLDIPPGVCKSASAQNLTIDTNLLHPDHTRLHKSRSLSSSTTHSIENIAKISRSSTMQSRQSISISDQTRSALQSESFDKAEVCPWEVEPEQSGEKNQKHVTYANSEDGEDKTPPSPQVLICPWDHLPPVENNATEEKEPQGDSVLTKTPVTMSASVPGSPRPKVTKDQRVFSFRTTTNKWLSVMGSVDASSKSNKDVHLNREDSGSQKSQESKYSSSSRRPSMENRSLQKISMSTTDGKPSLVKQNAVRLSSGDSSDRISRSFIILKSAVHPGDVDDNVEHVFLSRQSSRRSSISSWENASRTPSTRRRGSNRIRPASNVSASNVCPWDGASSAQQGEGPQKQQSIKADVCHQESLVSERSNVCPWECQEQRDVRGQESGPTEVCPWESKDIPVTSQTTLPKDSQTQQSLKHVTEVCPWETVETPKISIRQDSECANVCPWDDQGKAEGMYENLNPLENKGTLTVPLRQEATKSAIYPGASKEVISNNQPHNIISTALNQGEQVSKTWDVSDAPKIMEDTCPWEGESKESTNTYLSSQMTIKVDICPWETGHQGKAGDSQKGTSPIKAASIQIEGADKTKVNVCPWEVEIPQKTADTKMPQLLKRPLDVCPWETGESESGKPSDSHVRQATEEAGVVKTEHSKQLEKPQRQENVSPSERVDSKDSTHTNACPWETEEPKVVKKQDSTHTNVCPWETEEPKVVKKQDSTNANVCPWETEEPKVVKKQHSTHADVCPWETEEPKVVKKQDSTHADVCPWETEEPKVVKKQDSTHADVCPWETEEPKVVKKQDSTHADVCPWETEEPKVVKKQDSTHSDVCPWETEEPKVVKKQDSTHADVCPWETEEPKVVKKQDSTHADVCPWETEEPKVVKKQDSTHADVCPWETEEQKVVKKRDGIIEDAYPSEREEPRAAGKNDSNGEDKVYVSCSDNEDTVNQIPLGVENIPEDISTEQTDESKANLALGRRDALCPWDTLRSPSGSFTDNTSDVFTWEPENIPEEDEEDDAECAAEAFVFPSDL
ncbi:uncharacterized protein PAE49_004659 [Odontesthes bonariensis]|uniref:uncharacterized protein LOC142379063 n=1 Tax=Odontesthes bonariensis TaxID=219752 RepID=UPI003F588BC4